MPRYTINQLRKLEKIESKLALLRKEYPTAVRSRQKTITLMARSLKKAAELVTGRPYQKPLDTATAVPSV